MSSKLLTRALENITRESGLAEKDVVDILTYLSDDMATYQLQSCYARLAHHMIHGLHFHLNSTPKDLDESILSNLEFLKRQPVIVDFYNIGDLFTVEAFFYDNRMFTFRLYRDNNPEKYTVVTVNRKGDIVYEEGNEHLAKERVYCVAYAISEYRKALAAKSEDIYVSVEACRLLKQDSSQSLIYLV